jgi:two-component system cell cycle sensor histidine kinase/response regulator CckA
MVAGRPAFLSAVEEAFENPAILDRLIDDAPFNLIIDRVKGGCIYANQTLLHTFNMSWEEFAGYGWARAVHPGDGPIFQKAATDFLTGRRDQFDLRYRVLRQPHGEVVWLQALVRAIRDQNGTHVGNVGVSVDVTELQQRHERSSHSQKMEALGRLSGRVAHDLNNLLGVVLACAHLIDRKVPGRVDEQLAALNSTIEHARKLTDQLMFFGQSRAAARTSVLDDELRRIAPLIARTLGEAIRYEAVLEAGDATVPLDRGQIGQITLNLVANARDAITGSGTVRIRSSADSDLVRWSVEDDGAGMSPELVARATEPFFTTKSPDRGTGLGLATVSDLLRMVNAELVIESEPGRGTRIAMTLPQLKGLPAPAAGPAVDLEAGPAQGTVILLEDHDALRQSLAFSLSFQGYRVLSTGSLAEALAAAAQETNLVALVTDVHLPDGTGIECAKALRLERPDLVVVYTSGFVDVVSDLGAREAFLVKPLVPRELLSVLQSLQKRRG